MSTTAVRYSDLPPSWQDLVRRMQRINFGVFTNLRVVDGLPEFHDDFESTATYRFPGDNSPRPESMHDDFVLPMEVVEFIETLQELYCRHIARVEIRHGLPVRMEVDDIE